MMRPISALTPVITLLSGLLLSLFLANCSTGSKTHAESRVEPVMDATPPDSLAVPRATLLDSGRVYFQACAICHGNNGHGGRGPTLANSDYVQGDRERLIRTVLDGVREPIRVNGVRWKTGEMLGWAETWPDFKIAAVLTYIRAALNDSTVVSCVNEDVNTGTWASCVTVPRPAAEIAADSVSVEEVSAVRRTLTPRSK
jgi:mono/diheme cytochrome c family protein